MSKYLSTITLILKKTLEWSFVGFFGLLFSFALIQMLLNYCGSICYMHNHNIATFFLYSISVIFLIASCSSVFYFTILFVPAYVHKIKRIMKTIELQQQQYYQSGNTMLIFFMEYQRHFVVRKQKLSHHCTPLRIRS